MLVSQKLTTHLFGGKKGSDFCIGSRANIAMPDTPCIQHLLTCTINLCQMDVSENSGFSPQIIHFNRVSHYKPSILGYPYFRKHPNVGEYSSPMEHLGILLFHPFPDGRYSRRTRLPIGVFMEPAAQSGVNFLYDEPGRLSW